ncbi:SDR family oxidoreductase [Gryllotalpicola ginsengisoli]|uniref:SDR family oxidoreductase n=1 Tax=Gryllotalpicola ginsengisoli TaxID=444608 RepID=UPI0003B76841|nr:SDR family oxidoreductase [Gryllotalpicola ginsengisoli]
MTTITTDADARTRQTAPTPAEGRVILTGGSSGLGAAVVAALRDRGATPAVLDMAPPRDGDTAYREVDVTDSAAVAEAVAQLRDELGGIDAVVTAAGIDRPGKLDDIPADAWEKVIGVNLIGVAATVRAALPALKESHGRIVTVASTLALKGVSDATAYCASKFGVLGFSRALAAELAGEVGVTTLIPGGMRTHFFDGRDAKYAPGDDAKLNDPANTANAVVFALSQPRGCEVRELLIAHEEEPSWP